MARRELPARDHGERREDGVQGAGMQVQPVGDALRAGRIEPGHGGVQAVPAALDQGQQVAQRRDAGRLQTRGDRRREPAVDRVIRRGILGQRPLHARKRGGLRARRRAFRAIFLSAR
jgi:hypothetical protein